MIKDILLVKQYETYALQNVLHMAFMQAVIKRVVAFIGQGGNIDDKLPGKLKTQYFALMNAESAEDECYLLANKNVYTARIEEQDSLRDDIWRKIKKLVETYATVDFDQEKHEAALNMQPLMERYAIDVKASYEIETTQIDQWYQEQSQNFQTNQAAQRLGVAEQITALKEANDEVRRLITLRMDEQSRTQEAALKAARAVSDEEWRYFELALNSYAVADETDDRFEDLIRALNAEIDYSQEQYKALKKKNAKKKDKGGDDPEPEPEPTPEPTPEPEPQPEPEAEPEQENPE